jgi:hypothetical protein
VLVVGLCVPGLVFCCFAGGRRVILFDVEEVLLFRGVAEEEPDWEAFVEGFLPFTDGLTAIAIKTGSSQGCFRRRLGYEAEDLRKHFFMEQINLDAKKYF